MPARDKTGDENGQRPHPQTVELRIPSELGSERSAIDLTASVAKRMGFPADRVDDIKTAVSEATLNAIEHGNRLDTAQKVFIELIPEGETLKIDVHDKSATPYAPEEGTEAPSLEDKLAGLSNTRGWGTFLIQALVDEAEFSSTSDGNVVRMVIHLER